MELFEGEVRFGKSTLPECCRTVATRVASPLRECLNQTYSSLQQQSGRFFPEVIREKMEPCLEELPLKKEDRQVIWEVFANQSFQDGDMQMRHLELGREQLQKVLISLENEKKEQCRMAVGLGAMSGLLLVLVLL